MKTYEKSKYFIKKYEIQDDKLFCYLGNGDIWASLYSDEVENNIINAMEDRVDMIKKNQINKLKLSSNIQGLIGFVTGIGGIINLNAETLWEPLKISPYIISICLWVSCMDMCYKSLENYSLKRDIEKNKMYVKHKDLFLEFDKNNDKLKQKLSKKTINKIEQSTEDKPVFTINTIDNYSLSELKKIKKNLEKEYKVLSDDNSSEKTYQYTK